MASDMIKIEERPEYQEAVGLMRKKRYGAASEILGALLEKSVEDFGDMGSALAPVYYMYGDALLKQVEATSAVFGESVKTQKQLDSEKAEADAKMSGASSSSSSSDAAPLQTKGEEGDAKLVDSIMEELMKEYETKNGKPPTDEVLQQWKQQFSGMNMGAVVGAIGAGGEPADTDAKGHASAPTTGDDKVEKQEGGEEEKQVAEEEEEKLGGEDLEEVLNIAWEIFETARVILNRAEAEATEEAALKYIRKLMATTFLRLADHSMERGLYKDSIADYEKSLEKHRQVFAPNSFEMCDVQSHLAIAHVFASSEETAVSGRRAHHFSALQAYIMAIFALVNKRAELLGNEEVREPKLKDAASKEDEEDDDEGGAQSKAKMPKIEAKPTAEGEEPPLTASEVAQINIAKSELARILSGVPTLDSIKDTKVAEDDEIADKLVTVIASIDELRMKTDDVFLVLENKEAAEAIAGGSGNLVEDEIKDAAGGGAESVFDKPTLSQPANTLAAKSSSATSTDSTGPTNLMQARKKAEPGNGNSALASDTGAQGKAPAVSSLAAKRKPTEEPVASEIKRAKV